ncbi:MAG: phosphotransferase enzyme family protein, partial [Anaerolineae bacterium]
MDRGEIVRICERDVLNEAARRFGTRQEDLGKFDDYEGCANLVYNYVHDGEHRILRMSFRPERSVDDIHAELEFVYHLSAGGVRVSVPVPSLRGNLIEVLDGGGTRFIAVSFVRGRGMRVPDNGYRYRPGVPIEEYFSNWGQVLGQMHLLAQGYRPAAGAPRRPEWYAMEGFAGSPAVDRLPVIGTRYEQLMAELRALPRDGDAYGLIHGDMNDGNFTVDYDNGDITVFDFDDCCYCWFIYDLACAWEGGIGRAMFRPLAERHAFMEHYMDQVLEGYARENVLSEAWLDRLPLFLRVIQMQELVHYLRYIDDPDEEIQAGIRYKRRCIEEDIPWLGFFDPVLNPGHPFALRPSLASTQQHGGQEHQPHQVEGHHRPLLHADGHPLRQASDPGGN